MENYTVQDLEQLTIRQVMDLVIALREEIKSLIREEERGHIQNIIDHTDSTNYIPMLLHIEEIAVGRLSPEKQTTAKSLKELKFKIFDATNID